MKTNRINFTLKDYQSGKSTVEELIEHFENS